MKSLRITVALLVTLAALATIAGPALAEKVVIEKLDDLPRYTYQVDVKAAEFVGDDEAIQKLAAEVKKDLLADLEKYDIKDQNTVQEYYSSLATIAMLQGDYEAYLGYSDKVRELEMKEAQKLTTGLTGRAYIAARKAPEGERQEAFRSTFAELVNPLPYEVVEPQFKQMKGMTEMISENLIVGIMESQLQPMLDKTGGEVSKDVALQLLGTANTVKMFVPYKGEVNAVLAAYLEEHAVTKQDIWSEREVELTGDEGGSPVVVTIWDSGLDCDIPGLKNMLWVNEDEVPGNNKDDDGNGFVDDIHGVAYTLHSDKTTEVLYPIGDVKGDRDRLQRQMKGLVDITMGVDSEEATELKQKMASLPPEEAGPFMEGVNEYGNFCHGTHVAGIAMEGNPYIRVMVSRLTFGHELIPEEPTVEQARKDSAATVEMVQYFADNGSRVVNMSWGGSLAGVEGALEQNNAGGTPEERKTLARKIFNIGVGSLENAMKNTPQILYVTSAGNADNDVTFEEFVPSGFELDNMIVVGAVDQAGDETGFTSFGNVDCYASGYEVESYVPGGDRMPLSGTSQASPQVTNLAAKILAFKPDMSPTEVKALILEGCDDKQVGDRTIKLINPKKTMELLMQS